MTLETIYPTFFSINEITMLPDSKDKIQEQDFSNVNYELVLNDFASIQWQHVFSESQNVNQLFEVFFSKCSEIVNEYFPLKRLSRMEVIFNSNPWISKALRKSINYIENNTWSRGDMEFIFECSHRYRTRSLRSLVRYRMWTRKDKFHISKRPCIILFII